MLNRRVVGHRSTADNKPVYNCYLSLAGELVYVRRSSSLPLIKPAEVIREDLLGFVVSNEAAHRCMGC